MPAKYISDLTEKQRDHICRIYLWAKWHDYKEFYWSEDDSFSKRTIDSLINHELINPAGNWSVKITSKGINFGRKVFVRTCKYDPLDKLYGEY